MVLKTWWPQRTVILTVQVSWSSVTELCTCTLGGIPGGICYLNVNTRYLTRAGIYLLYRACNVGLNEWSIENPLRSTVCESSLWSLTENHIWQHYNTYTYDTCTSTPMSGLNSGQLLSYNSNICQSCSETHIWIASVLIPELSLYSPLASVQNVPMFLGVSVVFVMWGWSSRALVWVILTVWCCTGWLIDVVVCSPKLPLIGCVQCVVAAPWLIGSGPFILACDGQGCGGGGYNDVIVLKIDPG